MVLFATRIAPNKRRHKDKNSAALHFCLCCGRYVTYGISHKMTVFFILVNITLTILSLWGVMGAYNNSTSFKDVTGIDVHAEAAWYLLPIVIAAISTQVEGAKTIGAVCAVIVTLCGGYMAYDSWNDTVGNTQECVGNAGLDIDKQNECVNDVLSPQ